MPNRYVRASAIESEAVNSLSWQAEVFFRRLLNRADDFGRFTANHQLLRASLFPLQLEKVSVADVGRLFSECERAGLFIGYQVGQKPYLVMAKWEKGRAKSSDYPAPPPDVIERMNTYVYTRKHMSADAPDSDTVSDSESESAHAHTRETADAEIPSEAEVVSFGSARMIPAAYCQEYHAKRSENHEWIKNGRLIDWRSQLGRYWSKDSHSWSNGHRKRAESTPEPIKRRPTPEEAYPVD